MKVGASHLEFWDADTGETIYEATINHVPRVGEMVDLTHGNGPGELGVYHVIQTHWIFAGDGNPIIRIKLRQLGRHA